MNAIEWTDETWNPVRGCSIVSKGCTNCYAMKQAHRFSGIGGPYEGLTKLTAGGPVWTGQVQLVPDVLSAPLHWRKHNGWPICNRLRQPAPPKYKPCERSWTPPPRTSNWPSTKH